MSRYRVLWVSFGVVGGFFVPGVPRAAADPPGNWCPMTGPGAEAREGEGATMGDCDLAAVRAGWLQGGSPSRREIRIKFLVFGNDEGTEYAASQEDLNAQVDQLNEEFSAYKIQFTTKTVFIHNDRFYDFCGSQSRFDCFCPDTSRCGDTCDSEELAMKGLYADDPDEQLNVYVVNPTTSEFRAIGYFPWCDEADWTHGGVIIIGDLLGGEGDCNSEDCGTLSHEIGHNLGLWHTHHGNDTALAADDLVPTVALVPVGSTGPHVIVGNEILIPCGGVAVELEIWAHNLQQPGRVCLHLYQATIDSTGYSSATNGTLTPASISCHSDEDCRGGAVCTKGTCDVRAAGFIDWETPTWLFYGLPAFWVVHHESADFMYGAVIEIAACYTANSGYLGTLVLDVSDNASGTFTVGFLGDPQTRVEDQSHQPIRPLTLFAGSIAIQSYSLDDVALWTACTTGPGGGALKGECLGLDVNADGTIDLRDFAAVQILFVSTVAGGMRDDL